jgi:GDP-L-fucose synthase
VPAAIPEPIFIAGHRGLVGSALVRACAARGLATLVRSRQELDLRDAGAVARFVGEAKPQTVIIAAAKVGGILANDTWRYDFLAENLAIELALIEACRRQRVPRLLFLGSSCIYPKHCPQPMREEHLLTGTLEQTNEPYAIAKIAGLKLVESCNRQHGSDWISTMPTNLYGPGDNFDLNSSHVLPAMLRKFHEARLAGDAPVTLWGSGTPRREFLHVDDLAAGCLHLLAHLPAGQVPGDLVNLGCGTDVSIRELAELVQRTVGHRGPVVWDSNKPDGTPRKLLDITRATALGWQARIPLAEGLATTYRWYQDWCRTGTPPSTPHT